jgi:hypothetical protein
MTIVEGDSSTPAPLQKNLPLREMNTFFTPAKKLAVLSNSTLSSLTFLRRV